MATLEDTPTTFDQNSTEADQKEWVQRAAERLVDSVWLGPTKEDVQAVFKTYATDDLQTRQDGDEVDLGFCCGQRMYNTIYDVGP